MIFCSELFHNVHVLLLIIQVYKNAIEMINSIFVKFSGFDFFIMLLILILNTFAHVCNVFLLDCKY